MAAAHPLPSGVFGGKIGIALRVARGVASLLPQGQDI